MATDELTSDPYELAIINDDDLDEVEPTDPHYREVCRLTNEIAHISRKLPAKRKNVARKLLEGKTQVQIAQEIGCHPSTVSAALDDAGVKRQIVLLQRLNHIRRGPSQDARSAMLWRIAMREEERRPSISINAVNTLNKMDGTYIDETTSDSGVVVKIQNFVVNTANAPDPKEMEKVIEGEFTPVTLNAELVNPGAVNAD